jgi:hypothetical protein
MGTGSRNRQCGNGGTAEVGLAHSSSGKLDNRLLLGIRPKGRLMIIFYVGLLGTGSCITCQTMTAIVVLFCA